MAKKTNSRLGAWAFLIGVILAIVFAFFTLQWLGLILFVIGLIVGLFNISDAETKPFLFAGAILVIVSYFGGQYFDFVIIQALLNNMMAIFVPATIIVALKSVFSIAKN